MLATQAPFIAYTGLDGLPLNDGSIYFGTANLNPETNPIVVYWDAAGTQPAAQPIQTLNGFTVRSGTPAAVYASADYSINVRDSRGRLVYFAPSAALLSNDVSLQTQITAAAAALASTAGAGLVGYDTTIDYVTATVGNKLRHLDYDAYPSVADSLTFTQIAAIQAGTSTQDLTAIIQALIDARKPFRLIPGGDHRCNGTLTWKSGAVMIGSYSGVVPGSGDDVGATILRFNETLTSIGIDLNKEVGVFQHSFGFVGITFDVITPATGRAGFKHFNIATTGLGCYNFSYRDVSIKNCRYGFYIDSSAFAFLFDNVHVINAYAPFYKTSNGFITSWSTAGWFKMSFCFYGMHIDTSTYNRVDHYYDNCGLTIPWLAEVSTTEMPVLGYYTNSANFNGTVGIENSNGIYLWATNYSTIELAVHGFASVATLWQFSTTRISNIPKLNQALHIVDTSFVKIKNWQWIATTGAGYPAASTTDPSYFARIITAGDPPRLMFENCFLTLPSYCVSPLANVPLLFAPDATNPRMTFGATNICTLYNQFGIESGLARFGDPTPQTYHSFLRNAVFTAGDEAFRVTGATGASAALRVFAVNGAAANTANTAVKVSADGVTGRSIGAPGTINASGTDYAEYELKREDCGTIAKGDICGFDSAGLLTDKWSLACTFGVKSTNPSFVGGDVFSLEEEEARGRVDRIAYAGKVPVNMGAANPGDCINAAEGPNDSIVAAVSTDIGPRTVGRVINVGADGRPVVKVL